MSESAIGRIITGLEGLNLTRGTDYETIDKAVGIAHEAYSQKQITFRQLKGFYEVIKARLQCGGEYETNSN